MKFFRTLLGDYFDLVIHVLRATAVFIIVLGCIYVARTTVPKLFPPGDYLSQLLHLADSYAALLGTVGYVVWISLDMYLLLRERLLRSRDEQKHTDNK